jgi:hypothetical protein
MGMPRRKKQTSSAPSLEELVNTVKKMTSQLREGSEDVLRRAHRLDEKAHQVDLKAQHIAQNGSRPRKDGQPDREKNGKWASDE